MTQHPSEDSGLHEPPRGNAGGASVPIEGQPAERVRFHVGTRRSGGRPALPAERRRSVVVTVRLSPAEFERAFGLAHASGAKNVRAFMRSAVLAFAAQPAAQRPPQARGQK